MITVDPDAAEPPYEQVREQIRAQVQAGELTPGTRLPTVRRLAGDLGLATNTVARAYRELEALGVIETRGRAGSVVTGDGVDRAAREAAHDYVDPDARARRRGGRGAAAARRSSWPTRQTDTTAEGTGALPAPATNTGHCVGLDRHRAAYGTTDR